MSEVAVFAYKGDRPKMGGNLSGLPQIFGLLKERDLNPHVSLGGESAYQEDDVAVHELNSETSVVTADRSLGYESAAVIINRLDRLFRNDQLPAGAPLPPMINENATRSITNDKHRIYEGIFQPLGIGVPTLRLDSKDALSEFIEDNLTGLYVIKPIRGSGGKGITTVGRKKAAKTGEAQLDGTKIIQPYYDFSGSLPPDLRPYDRASRDLFDDIRATRASKELRVYGFQDPERTAVFAVGRAINKGADYWFFVDPGSLPADVYDKTKAAIKSTAELTGAKAMFGTVDFGFGGLKGQDPAWHAIELNSKQPYMIGYDKHAGVARHLRTLFADQIRSVVST